jgi:nitroreductase
MRQTDCPKLDPMFTERWSPRAFASDAVSDENMHTLFEAAHWSPSCFNEQPWHFVYARSEDDLQRFRALLVDSNRVWASAAPLLVLVFSRRAFTNNGKPNRWADFDTGAAWMALTLQANRLGLHCHAMGGFDERQAYAVAGVDPQRYNAICVIAVGGRADPQTLPEELRSRETPNGRRPAGEFVSEGRMRAE